MHQFHEEPEEMTPTEQRELKKSRRRSRTVGPESRPTFEGLQAEMPQFIRIRQFVRTGLSPTTRPGVLRKPAHRPAMLGTK